ncbi:HNH endonuclease signature motif containing protein [Streptomyces sp. LHD-70]|uniref:HNH endonuclease signature motif containing protein n=1 Tax=Streptomyces sp. LHD-70 TaxID=3072140 RepID=UPI00280E232E|nr:HNH endonuclease signature motif containing protein [Streptomyces sp. LHD-70]MDQ8706768.1 HNH endonuclease signature motif containing protein [Streptomyces sp. LHD-70]
MQTCPVAGCPCPTWRGKCRAHARSSSTGRRYRDSYRSSQRDRWARASRAYLREHPLCESESCSAIAAPLRPSATEVDHVDGLGLQGPRSFDPSNWQALCKSCHSRKTASESFGR